MLLLDRFKLNRVFLNLFIFVFLLDTSPPDFLNFILFILPGLV